MILNQRVKRNAKLMIIILLSVPIWIWTPICIWLVVLVSVVKVTNEVKSIVTRNSEHKLIMIRKHILSQMNLLCV